MTVRSAFSAIAGILDHFCWYMIGLLTRSAAYEDELANSSGYCNPRSRDMTGINRIIACHPLILLWEKTKVKRSVYLSE